MLGSSTCSRPPQPISQPTFKSEQLKLEKFDELQKSILKITCSAYYQNYFYLYPDSSSQESQLYYENITSNSVAGTGLLLYQDLHRQVLLSCYHVFNFKDTIKTYYLDKDKQPTKFLNSLSIKTGQKILVFHKNGKTSDSKIISIDESNDIALIETTVGDVLLSEFPFRGSFKNAKKIKLGQEAYLLGFPKGFFMVTRGLVSPSPFKNKFIVDAPFNRGFSGGIVITFTDNELYYQYIGMANSIAFSSEPVLTPRNEPTILDQYQNLPYDGDIYVKELKLINYGITFAVKSNVIIDFLDREEKKLKQLGYNISAYLD